METEQDVVVLGQATIDTLMPMHLEIGPSGDIVRAGPTLHKLCDGPLVGRSFWDIFDLRRPAGLTSLERMKDHIGSRVQLGMRSLGGHDLRGTIQAVPDGLGVFMNLGFGISVVDAVAKYKLTSGDFAATDLTVELLYLVEAKSAVLEESRLLNQRLQGAKIAAEEQAFTDTLTGLKNRRAMDHVLARLITSGQKFSLMHLDLDFFKAVNDTLGHAAGDHVLQAVAQVLVSETRDEDTIARVGGDEFVLVLTRTTDPSRLGRTAERIIAKLEEPVMFEGKPCRISGSIGITVSDLYASPETDRMLADADTALYASKRKGRACHTMFDPAAHLRMSEQAQPQAGNVAR